MVKRISTTMTVDGGTTGHSLVVDNDDIIGGPILSLPGSLYNS